MLALSRKRNEAIVINNDIEITILDDFFMKIASFLLVNLLSSVCYFGLFIRFLIILCLVTG